MSYKSPYGAFQVGHLCQVVQHPLEHVVSVVEAPPKHYLADDVGHGVVQQGHGVKRLPWTETVRERLRRVFMLTRASPPTFLPLHGLLQVTALFADAPLHGAVGQAKRAQGGHGEAALPPPNVAVAEEQTS